MRYVARYPETGKVRGHFANEQSYAKELLPDDHPDILEWERANRPDPKRKGKLERLEDEVAALKKRREEALAKLGV